MNILKNVGEAAKSCMLPTHREEEKKCYWAGVCMTLRSILRAEEEHLIRLINAPNAPAQWIERSQELVKYYRIRLKEYEEYFLGGRSV